MYWSRVGVEVGGCRGGRFWSLGRLAWLGALRFGMDSPFPVEAAGSAGARSLRGTPRKFRKRPVAPTADCRHSHPTWPSMTACGIANHVVPGVFLAHMTTKHAEPAREEQEIHMENAHFVGGKAAEVLARAPMSSNEAAVLVTGDSAVVFRCRPLAFGRCWRGAGAGTAVRKRRWCVVGP
jgi:hypothetical protein